MALREAPQPGKEYLTLVSSHNYQVFFFFQAEYGIRDIGVTGVQTCALPISPSRCVFSFDCLKEPGSAAARSRATEGFSAMTRVLPILHHDTHKPDRSVLEGARHTATGWWLEEAGAVEPRPPLD